MMKAWWPTKKSSAAHRLRNTARCSRVSQTEKFKNDFIGNYECQIKVNYYVPHFLIKFKKQFFHHFWPDNLFFAGSTAGSSTVYLIGGAKPWEGNIFANNSKTGNSFSNIDWFSEAT